MYIHTDGLGSPVAKSDKNGNLISGSRTRYEPYGATAAGATPTIGFTGHVYDAATGLVYMQQRYYDPYAGRFLSTDPVLTDANTGTSFNRYIYANNSPYKYIDPDGRDPEHAFLPLGVSKQENTAANVVAAGVALDTGLRIAQLFPQTRNSANIISGVIASVGKGSQGSKSAMNSNAKSSTSGSKSDSAQPAKSRNGPPEPLAEAEGRPHSIIERPGSEGQYTTHNGDGTWKQFRGSGQDHHDIPRPNVKEAGKNTTPDGRTFIDKGRVRPATPAEIPKAPNGQ